MEKEGSYRDAADHYEFAWRLGNEAVLAVGFKLAYNYLRAKRYLDAVDIARKVCVVY